MIQIPLFLSQDYPCSYLENQQSRSAFVHPSYQMTSEIYAQLMSQGFRRSGDEVYKPHCQTCSACIPVRVPVAHFTPNRSQKRCINKNINTQAKIKPALFEQAHYDMYIRYQKSRHLDGSMANTSPEDYLSFLSSTWSDTVFIEFSINNELASIAVVDQFDDSCSAVYTFFDPKFSDYSPGVFAVLWQIKHCLQANKEFLYLGLWIETCKKMTYKTNYQPLEYLIDHEWQTMNH
ncbi:MAG: arginyltransferase [Methylococcales bacterium]|nr:arginyltransferase [Methylococcales bacterium]